MIYLFTFREGKIMIRASSSLGICLVAGSAFGDGIDGKIGIVVKISNLSCSEDLIKR